MSGARVAFWENLAPVSVPPSLRRSIIEDEVLGAALRALPGAADDRRAPRRPQAERRPNSPFFLCFPVRNSRTPDRNSSCPSTKG